MESEVLRVKCMQKKNGLLLTRLDYQPLFGKWKAGPEGAAVIKLSSQESLIYWGYAMSISVRLQIVLV